MAVRAAGGQRVASARRLPVQAFRVLLLFIRVARAAVHRLEFLGMREFFPGELSVAARTLQRGVRRSAQGGLIERRGQSRLALARAAAGFVATKTRLGARKRFGLLSAQGHSQKNSSQARPAESDQKTLY